MMFWGQQKAAGMELGQIGNSMLTSPEILQRFGDEGPEPDQIVELLYQQALGRQADADGLAFWTGILAAETPESMMTVISGISESREHLLLTQSWINNDDPSRYGIQFAAELV